MEIENQLKSLASQKKQLELTLQQIQQNVTINHSTINNDQSAPLVLQAKHKNIKSKKDEKKKNQKGVEDNPQYFRVDMEICHKIYQIYRKLKLGGSQQEGFSFEQKEQGNQTMNYHKIMQIFKDIDFRLEINQKLTILRAIKKFCFNQNFINEEQFTKIFKVIVHGLGVKQSLFKPIIQAKYASAAQKQQSLQKRAISIKLNKNLSYKLKTEPTIDQIKIKSQAQVLEIVKQNKTIQPIKKNVDYSFTKKIELANQSPILQESQVSTSRKVESRKRIITEGSRYENLQQKGYLSRAIQKSKLNKVTWQTLFKMNEGNLYSNICIPHFVSQNITMEDPYF